MKNVFRIKLLLRQFIDKAISNNNSTLFVIPIIFFVLNIITIMIQKKIKEDTIRAKLSVTSGCVLDSIKVGTFVSAIHTRSSVHTTKKKKLKK